MKKITGMIFMLFVAAGSANAWILNFDDPAERNNITGYICPADDTGGFQNKSVAAGYFHGQTQMNRMNYYFNSSDISDGFVIRMKTLFKDNATGYTTPFDPDEFFSEPSLMSLGLYDSYWIPPKKGCQANPKPLSVRIDACNFGGGSTADCCLYGTASYSGAAMAVWDNISIDTACTDFMDRECELILSNPDDSSTFDLTYDCGAYTYTRPGISMSIFHGTTVFPAMNRGSLDSRYKSYLFDYISFEGPDPDENISVCYVDYSSIIRSNAQKVWAGVVGTPVNVIFQIDDVNFSYEGVSEGVYWYDWKITDETEGQHNITCYAVFGSHTETEDTYFQVRNASVVVQVSNENLNPYAGVDVNISYLGSVVVEDSTDTDGRIYANLRGDDVNLYSFLVRTGEYSSSGSYIITYDQTLYFTLGGGEGQVRLRTFLDGAGFCGGVLSEITIVRLSGGYSRTITGTGCVNGIGEVVTNLPVGTYAFRWIYDGVDTGAYEQLTIQADSTWLLDLYGSSGGNPSPPDPSTYSDVYYDFHVIDSGTYEGINASRVMVYSCTGEPGSIVQPLQCGSIEAQEYTNASGHIEGMKTSYTKYHRISAEKSGYITKILNVSTQSIGEYGGCDGGGYLLVDMTIELVPRSSEYFIFRVSQCDDGTFLENASVTCTNSGNTGYARTNSSGHAVLNLPAGFYSCDISKSGYLTKRVFGTYLGWGTYSQCLNAIVHVYNVTGYVKNEAGTGLNNAVVKLTCRDVENRWDILGEYQTVTNSTGRYALYDVLGGVQCWWDVNAYGYGRNTTETNVFGANEEKNFTVYQQYVDTIFMVETYESVGDHVWLLSGVRVNLSLYGDSRCANVSSSYVKTTGTDQEGYAFWQVTVPDEITHYRMSGTKDTHLSDETGCRYIASDYVYDSLTLQAGFADGYDVKISGRQLCNDSWIALTGYELSVYDVLGSSYILNRKLMGSESFTLSMSPGVYDFTGVYRYEGEYMAGNPKGNMQISGDTEIQIDFEKCFIFPDENLEREISKRSAMTEAEDLAYAFFPFMILLLVIGAMDRTLRG